MKNNIYSLSIEVKESSGDYQSEYDYSNSDSSTNMLFFGTAKEFEGTTKVLKLDEYNIMSAFLSSFTQEELADFISKYGKFGSITLEDMELFLDGPEALNFEQECRLHADYVENMKLRLRAKYTEDREAVCRLPWFKDLLKKVIELSDFNSNYGNNRVPHKTVMENSQKVVAEFLGCKLPKENYPKISLRINREEVDGYLFGRFNFAKDSGCENIPKEMLKVIEDFDACVNFQNSEKPIIPKKDLADTESEDAEDDGIYGYPDSNSSRHLYVSIWDRSKMGISISGTSNSFRYYCD